MERKRNFVREFTLSSKDKRGLALDHLHWENERLVAFDCRHGDLTRPFILAVPKDLKRGYHKGGLKLEFRPEARGSHRKGKWTFYPKGKLLYLWQPMEDEFDFKAVDNFDNTILSVETAYAGMHWIKNNLESTYGNLGIYGKMIEEGILTDETVSKGSLVDLLKK